MASAATLPTCASDGCSKPGKMVCPTCKKLGIPGSFFCEQSCFKKSWPSHKSLHKMFKAAAAQASKRDKDTGATKPKLAAEFAGFKFTGPLRPGNVSGQMRTPAGIKRPDYADDAMGRSLEEEAERGHKIVVWEKKEDLEAMREAGKFGREVLDIARDALRVGATGEDLDKAVFEACVERNVYPSPLNYYMFPKSLCVSRNEIICHGIPDDVPFADGDIVNLDVTIYHKGFHADLNETFLLGKVSDEDVALVKTAFDALKNAIEEVKPGVMYRELGRIIGRTCKKAGCSVVRRYSGHGCHKLFHTTPTVSHYANNKNIGVMKAGHAFTCEPMVNAGDWRDVTWPDNWTSATQDGKKSAQFEHTILVTEEGYELLTARKGTTTMVWDEDYSRRP